MHVQPSPSLKQFQGALKTLKVQEVERSLSSLEEVEGSPEQVQGKVKSLIIKDKNSYVFMTPIG